MGDDLFHGIDVSKQMKIRGNRTYGVSIAIARGESIETKCVGTGRYGQDFPVVPDMLFQAGSVSKPMFALTVLRYVDKGIIDLDADISGVVKEYTKIPMSFSSLLSHTAGYNVHGFLGYRANAPQLSLEEVLDGKGNSPKLRRIKPYGKQYKYSGGGITLAELAFTRITETSLRDAFEKEVAEPLGLVRSGYFQPLDEDLVSNAAFGGRLAYRENKEHGYHYYPEHAAAGFWTTPSELTKVGIAISRSAREGGLLRQETAQRMVTPVMEKYGLCVLRYDNDTAGHGGWNEGFLTSWRFSLAEDLCAVSMINRSNMFTSKALAILNKELYDQSE